MVCTEVISPNGIWNYGAERDVPGTYAAFELAVRNADFVWCMLEASLEACRARLLRGWPASQTAARPQRTDRPAQTQPPPKLHYQLPKNQAAGHRQAHGVEREKKVEEEVQEREARAEEVGRRPVRRRRGRRVRPLRGPVRRLLLSN